MTTVAQARLGDIAEFIRGINFKPDDVVPVGTNGTVVCLRTKNVQEQLDCDDLWAVPSEFVRRENQIVTEGDILISSANSWNLVGKCSWIPKLTRPTSFGGFVSVLRANRTKVDARYLYSWFSYGKTQALLRSFGQKTTNISNLNIERCSNLSIPLPPLPEQRRIAAILDQADALRAKRREALAQLDILTQSIFVDMFEREIFPTASLEDVCDLITDGTHQTPQYADSGFIFLSAKNVTSGYVDWENIKFIPESLHRELHRRLSPRRNDILLAKNGTTGVAAIVDRDCTFDIYVSLALLRTGREVLPGYLLGAINSPVCGRQFSGSLKGIGVPNLHLKEIRSTRVPKPPLALQEVFTKRMETVERQKASYRLSLSELDALFASLQHRAFRGEL